ncbi:hypothetical protein ABQE93_24350 [Mycolicibacterium sp. XJ662]
MACPARMIDDSSHNTDWAFGLRQTLHEPLARLQLGAALAQPERFTLLVLAFNLVVVRSIKQPPVIAA